MRYAVDILLAGYDDPNLATAFGTQLLHNGLQVEHQAGIVADILADFIHQKNQVEVGGFALHVFGDFLGQAVDADFGGFRAVEPVACGLIGNARRLRQRGGHVVLPEGKGLARGFPRLGVDLLKSCFEGRQLALTIQKTLKGGNLQVVAVIAAVFIKDLGEYAQNRVPVLAHGGFCINIEQNHLGGGLRDAAHHFVSVGIVIEFIGKVIDGLFAAHLFIGQQVGKNLEKVRFTAAEEARNPNANFICCALNALFVLIIKCAEVLLQLAGDYVFLQLLTAVFVVRLHHLDYAVDRAVNAFLEHILQFHSKAPCLYQIKGTIVVVVHKGFKQRQRLPVVIAGVKQHDRYVVEDMLQIIEDVVTAHIGKYAPHAGDHHHIAGLVIGVFHALDIGLRGRDALDLPEHKIRAVLRLHLRNAIQDAALPADIQQEVVQIICDHPAGAVLPVFTGGNAVQKMPNRHFLVGAVGKHIQAHLVAKSFVA